MFVGKLNERLKNLQYSVVKSGTEETPPFLAQGNPFAGEFLSVSWKNLMELGVDLRFSFAEGYYINQIVVRLDDRAKPYAVRLYNGEKTKLYAEHCCETGKTVSSRTIALSVEAEETSFVLEFVHEFSSVYISGIDIYGAETEGLTVFPFPKKISESGERVPASRFTGVRFSSPEGEGAFRVFREKFLEETGVELKEDPQGNVEFVTDSSCKKNGCRTEIKTDRILISASDLRGMIYGAETVLKLLEENTLPVCTVEDEPFVPFRGVHLFLPAEEDMPFAKRLIKYILSPFGYNSIIMEVGGALEFASHPEINENFVKANEMHKKGLWPAFPHGGVGGGKIVSKASVRDLVEYARGFGIEIIPEIQSLGHVQTITLAHPEVAEKAVEVVDDNDSSRADVPPSQFYHHCYCPSNPKSYEILFDIADEIIDTFRPSEYVHMGHDEVYQIGVCPVCSQRDPADLLAEDLNRIHAYLAAKGLKMMIWADMLQPVTKYRTPGAIHKIPKDIFLLDFIWYFHMTKDIEENLLKEDFPVAFGNLYSSHFPRYESRIRKNVLGGQISAWVQTNEEQLQREGKLYDFLLTAMMLWSDSYVGFCRYSYDAILRKRIPHLREQLQDQSYPSLRKNAEETVLFAREQLDPKGETGGVATLGEAFDSLVFENYTTKKIARIPWVALPVLGEYRVKYEDGEVLSVPVTYGGTVCHYARRQAEPFPHDFYRHNGYCGTWTTDAVETETVTGEFATLYRYEWINPNPQKKILSVEYVSANAFPTEVVTQRILGIR